MSRLLHRTTTAPLTVALLILLAAAFGPAQAGNRAEAEQNVEKAKATIDEFKTDPDLTWFRDNLPKAKAVLVVPTMLRGGFIIGGSGGGGVLMWRDEATGNWSYPAFYFMSSLSVGLQIGGEASQIILMVMTDRGRDAFLSLEFKLGADISVAAGPVGAGAKAQTADVIAFSKNQGLYGGISVEGAAVGTQEEYNEAYYGQPLTPKDILVRQIASNSHADPLRAAIGQARAVSTGGGSTTAPTQPPAPFDMAVIQRELTKRGYDPGPADGVAGPKTREAIRQYEKDAGITVTGQGSGALQARLTGQQ